MEKKGFNEICRAFWKDWSGEIRLYDCSRSQAFDICSNKYLEKYNEDGETNIAAPTHQMAMEWVEDKFGLFIEITRSTDINKNYHYHYMVLDENSEYVIKQFTDFPSRYQAIETALLYILHLKNDLYLC